MDLFVKAAAGVLITLVLCLVLVKQGKDMATLLTLAVCCMVLTAAISAFRPVMDFFQKLETMGKLDPSLIKTLFKAVGIGILSEITGLICTDAGNSAMGKSLQILASVVILTLSVPIFTQLLELIENILVNK